MRFEDFSRIAYGNPKAPPGPRPLHIALLGYRSHPQVGGQGIYLKYLSRALTQIGHQVDVLSGPPYPELDDNINLIKIPSLDLYSVFPNHIKALRWHHMRSWSNVFEWWTMASGGFAEPYCFGRRAYQYLKRNVSYDIIHDNQSLSFALLKLQELGVPLVTTIHHPITQDRQLALQHEPRWGHRLLIKRWYSFLSMQRKVARQLRHIVTVSEASSRDLQTAFGCQASAIAVIPNGVDTEVFRPLPSTQVKALRIITTTSSDQPLKGFASLLHALAIIRQTFPRVHLRVIGKLQHNGANQRLLEQLQLQHSVSFRSQLTDAQLCEEYAKANLAVCPSLYEGFGLPAVEAMACAVPLLSSDGGALAEVVGDGGVLFPAGNVDALAKHAIEILSDDVLAQQLRQRGRRRVLNRYCWSRVATQLSDYYYALLPNQAISCKP